MRLLIIILFLLSGCRTDGNEDAAANFRIETRELKKAFSDIEASLDRYGVALDSLEKSIDEYEKSLE